MAAKKKHDGPRFPPRSVRGLASRHRPAALELAEGLDALAQPGWHFEVFWEQGYRLSAVRFGAEVGLFADDLREWTGPAAPIALALKELPATEFVLEGWLAVLDDAGRPDFERLKARMTGRSQEPLVFMLSDCVHLVRDDSGRSDLRSQPLQARRAALRELLPGQHRTLVAPQELHGTLSALTSTLETLGLHGLLARKEAADVPALVVSVDDEPLALSRSLSAAPRVTNQDKVLFPRDGFTKSDLVTWYREVAPVLLPHMKGRPIVAQRWPDGIDEFTWFQHRAPPRAPDYLKSTRIKVTEGTPGDRRILIDNLDALLWMVNQAALTFHGWATRVGTLAHPDWAIIDLDPGTSTTWAHVIEIAQAVHALLELLEVPSVVKTSGQKGLHVLVPLAPGQSLTDAYTFAHHVCGMIARLKPELVSLEAESGPRRGRLYLDCLQNYEGKTLVLPYSVRAADGAPVSMPISWSEVTPTLDPKSFTIRTAMTRITKHGDLCAPLLSGGLDLKRVLARLGAA